MNAQQIDDIAIGDGNSVRSVLRAIEILTLIDDRSEPVTLRQIVTDTGLAKTTALRLVQTLEHAGLIWRNTSKRFVAGPSLLRWAQLAAQSWQLPPEVLRILAELSTRCEETANIYIRHDLQRVCIAQCEGPHTLRHIVQIGDRLPLWAGSGARILLLDADADLIDRVAHSSPSGDVTSTRLWQRLASVRRDGYAVSHGERERGASSMAMPLRNRGGSVVAALSVGGPTARFTAERMNLFRRELSAASALINKQPLERVPAFRD